ncbi:uncharacterized protein LOC143882945 [Tasmannia lanceolata]|uniref:uncharacterized protein LOC143882945 n=1 Tax=Tasmannia lanceolata TaxID=3420 RepID=UPI004063B84F
MAEGTRSQDSKKLEAEIVKIRDSSTKQEEGIEEIKKLIASMDHKFAAMDLKYDQLAASVAISQQDHYGSSHSTPPTQRMMSFQGPIHPKFGKVEFPRFDGDDPLGWIYRVEQFFDYLWNKRWFQRTQKDVTWKDLVDVLCTRFGPNALEDFTGALTKLYQKSTVKEYQEKFEELAARTSGLGDEFFISCFVSGLKDEIRPGVQMFKPTTISQALGLARLQEDNVEALARRNQVTQPRADQLEQNPTPKPRLRSTDSFSNKRQLFLIEVGGSDSDEDTSSKDAEENEEAVEISVHALMGSLAPKTMRIRGYIKRRPVVILIDSGSTHNFLDPRVAKRTGCMVQPTQSLKVNVANGHQLMCNGICPNFHWVMHGPEFTIEVRLLPLEGYDVVLGIQWLTTLSDILWNFSKLRMEFWLAGCRHVIRGAKSGELHAIGRTKMEKTLKKQGQGALAMLCSITAETETNTDHPLLTELLQEFVKIFDEPKGLPPERANDHKIPLLPVKDEFSIPAIDELLDKLHGAQVFSKLDLRSGYHQIRCTVEVGRSIFNTCALLSLHSIITEYVKRSKCTFGQSQLEYLGHIISKDGVATNQAKVENMLSWPKPQTMKALQGFLGLTGYYRCFVKDCGKISKPLTDMLKKEGFHWTIATEKAFEALKKVMSSTLVLALPDFTKEFVSRMAIDHQCFD